MKPAWRATSSAWSSAPWLVKGPMKMRRPSVCGARRRASGSRGRGRSAVTAPRRRSRSRCRAPPPSGAIAGPLSTMAKGGEPLGERRQVVDVGGAGQAAAADQGLRRPADVRRAGAGRPRPRRCRDRARPRCRSCGRPAGRPPGRAGAGPRPPCRREATASRARRRRRIRTSPDRERRSRRGARGRAPVEGALGGEGPEVDAPPEGCAADAARRDAARLEEGARPGVVGHVGDDAGVQRDRAMRGAGVGDGARRAGLHARRGRGSG